jgi:ribosomal protein S4
MIKINKYNKFHSRFIFFKKYLKNDPLNIFLKKNKYLNYQLFRNFKKVFKIVHKLAFKDAYTFDNDRFLALEELHLRTMTNYRFRFTYGRTMRNLNLKFERKHKYHYKTQKIKLKKYHRKRMPHFTEAKKRNAVVTFSPYEYFKRVFYSSFKRSCYIKSQKLYFNLNPLKDLSFFFIKTFYGKFNIFSNFDFCLLNKKYLNLLKDNLKKIKNKNNNFLDNHKKKSGYKEFLANKEIIQGWFFYSLNDYLKETDFSFKLRQLKFFRFFYGGISKNQLKKYCKRAFKYRYDSVLHFRKILESRLDVILLRLGLNNSILSVKQDILHGRILVNDKCITYYNFEVKDCDIVSFKEEFKDILRNRFFNNFLKKRKKLLKIGIKKNLNNDLKEKFIKFLRKNISYQSFYVNIKTLNKLKLNLFKKNLILRRSFRNPIKMFMTRKSTKFRVRKRIFNFFSYPKKRLCFNTPIPSFFEYNLRTLEFLFLKDAITLTTFSSFDCIDFSYIAGSYKYY